MILSRFDTMKLCRYGAIVIWCNCVLLIYSCSSPDESRGLKVVSNLQEYQQEVNADAMNMLIDLSDSIANIALDLRYGTENNFADQIFYKCANAYVRYGIYHSLLAAQKEFNEQGYGLKIFDAYRPYSVTVDIYNIVQDSNYAATPWNGSRHNRGTTVDATIINLETSKEVEMPTEFDVFSPKAAPTYQDLPVHIVQNRDYFISVMKKHGFEVLDTEWWHFDYVDWQNYSLLDLSLCEIHEL